MANDATQQEAGTTPVDGARAPAAPADPPVNAARGGLLRRVRRETHYAGPPAKVVRVALYWVVALPVLAYAYGHWAWLHSAVPDPAGPVPLGVAWWGALGGLTISLVGIVSPSHNWEDRFRLWHYLRPLLGAVSGSVAYLIVFGLFRAAGAAPSLSRSSASVFDAVAFLVGFREHVFWQLVTRAADLLLAPGSSGDASPGSIPAARTSSATTTDAAELNAAAT